MNLDQLKEFLQSKSQGGRQTYQNDKLMVAPTPDTQDKNDVTPDQLKKNLDAAKDKGVITDDSGKAVDYDFGSIRGALSSASKLASNNPFLQSASLSDAPQGTMRNFLGRIMGSNPTDVGSAMSTGPLTPAQSTSPTPTAQQPQASLAPTTPAQPQSNPYAQPSALDPVGIEQLRISLLGGAGQLDPNNANGLAGRMTSPNADSDMGQQRNQAMGIEDSVRGFDGGPKPHDTSQLQPTQPTQPNSPQGQLTPGNIDLNNRPVVHNSDGSISTVRSITVTDDNGQAILIPTVVGDKVVSDKDAIDHFNQTGEHLGIFNSEDAAGAYAQQLHNDQATQYQGQ